MIDTLTQQDKPHEQTGTLTNELGLPTPIVNAIRGDDYSRGECDFTVTELIKPIRIRAAWLTDRYERALVEITEASHGSTRMKHG